MPSAMTMESYMPTRKRAAPSGETTNLRSSKRQKARAVSPIFEKATPKACYIGMPDASPPRSNIYTPSAITEHDLRKRQLRGESIHLVYVSRKGVDVLRCRLSVLVGFELRHLVDFRLLPGEALHEAITPRSVEVFITRIADEDDETYTCAMETVVYNARWCGKTTLDKDKVDEHLVVQWLLSQGEIKEIRETTEEPIPADVEAAMRCSRTISVVQRPRRTRDPDQTHTFLVDCWDRSEAFELQGTIVEQELLYRGHEKEKRLWLRLQLRLVQDEASDACGYIHVSGDVESEDWVVGRFMDDCPGQLFWE